MGSASAFSWGLAGNWIAWSSRLRKVETRRHCCTLAIVDQDERRLEPPRTTNVISGKIDRPGG